jgi:exopolysaccharide biosynthesis polyprenyl glycosylphosphotransferase
MLNVATESCSLPHLIKSGRDDGQWVYAKNQNAAAERQISEKVSVLASILSVGDALVFACVGMGSDAAHGHPMPMLLPVLIATVSLTRLVALQDGYGVSALRDLSRQAWILAGGSMIWILIAWAASLTFFDNDTVQVSRLAVAAAIGFAACLSIRAYVAWMLAAWSQAGSLNRTIAIVGVNDVSRKLIWKLRRDCPATAHIVGVYDMPKHSLPATHAGSLVRGDITSLIEHARDGDLDLVIIALPPEREDLKHQALEALSGCACDIATFVEFEPLWSRRARFEKVGEDVVLAVMPRPISGARGAYKSMLDRVVALVLLIALAPAFALIALAIRLESRGPVFFYQARRGFKDRTFQIIKFRTMYDHLSDAECQRQTARNDERVTRVGRILRQTSIDELPQLVNVLRGEMSLVGPRPHARGTRAGPRALDEVASNYRLRHRVKPGMTGLAQINNCRGAIHSEDQLLRRVAHDVAYMEDWSLFADVKILALTLVKGFVGQNVH